MKKWSYYNENDPYAAQWIRNLIAAKLIPDGEVDERDIRDIKPDDLGLFAHCHFFAGVAVWAYSLRQAGWSDDREIWTGSCPCQPFSAAGRAGGFADERHLWPHWHWLISQCRPRLVVGEQVASKDGLGWYDLVSSDLEGTGYAVGALDLCAAGIGVEWQESQSGEWLRRAIHDCADPVVRSMLCDFADWAGEGNISEGGNHIRQRLYFVGLADSAMRGRQYEPSGRPANVLDQSTKNPISRAELGGHGASVERRADSAGPRSLPGAQSGVYCGEKSGRSWDGQSERRGSLERLDDDDDARPQGHAGDDGAAGREGSGGPVAAPGVSVGLADTDGKDSRTGLRNGESAEHGVAAITGRGGDGERPDAADGRRYAKDWLFCRDDRWRAVESGTFPLVNGAAARVGKLRAFGNALDAETATRFCETVKELIDG